MFNSPHCVRSSRPTAIALLTVAFIFIPAVLIASRSVGYLLLSLGTACSITCSAFARVHWREIVAVENAFRFSPEI